MRRAIVMLLVSWAYIGCGPRAPLRGQPQGPPSPTRGGSVRIVIEGPEDLGALYRSAVAEPLVAGALAASGPSPSRGTRSGRARCREFRIAPRAAYPDGTPVRSADVVESWRSGLADPDSGHHWLLEPFVGDGGAGLSALDDRRLRLCPTRPTPDLETRLLHPDLWFWRSHAWTGRPTGPGAFRVDDRGVLVPNPVAHAGGPWLDAVIPLESGGRGSDLLLRLREADLAVVYGDEAGSLIRDPEATLTLERFPRRDRVYFLRIDRWRRWVNDPRFRRWLAGVVDREAMVRHLFDGRGAAAFALSDGERREAVWDVESQRPLARDSVPRLVLDYEAGDRHARAVAERLRERLALLDVRVAIRPRAASSPGEGIRASTADLELLRHRPLSDDPVLALFDTVGRLGEAARPAARLLVQASRSALPEERRDGAWLAEEALLRDADVVPLVRLHAWIAARTGLEGLVAGPDGRFRLEELRWNR